MAKIETIISRFANKLRPLTPDADTLSDEEVIEKWEPNRLSYAVDEYGDQFCTCGHPIKYVYSVRLKGGPSKVIYDPVGSECIDKIFGGSSGRRDAESLIFNLNKMLNFLQKLRSGRLCNVRPPLSENDVCANNGFTARTIDYLEGNMQDVLRPQAFAYLRELFKKRNVTNKTVKQTRFLDFICAKLIDFLSEHKTIELYEAYYE